ncbi:hypothetical protein BJ138DRAFT_977204, partial [Hygrophoropsis aurantiaca]
ADGPGMVYLNGLVGHSGKNGCRLYCGTTGRRKEGGPYYYPALLKPGNGYDIPGSNHDDIDIADLPPGSAGNYFDNLRLLIASSTQAE